MFDLIMDFLIPLGLLPSNSLYMEYAQSEVTKMLNTLQTREFYNEKFSQRFQMSEEDYDRLKKRYSSRPPFVFLFNPDIQLEQFIDYNGDTYNVGYRIKDKWVSIDFKS